MERFDLEKLESAITYVERIADGKNPVNNTIADSDDVMNDPIIIRSMFFIKDVLIELKNNDGIIGKSKGEFKLNERFTKIITNDKKIVEENDKALDMIKDGK